MIGVLQGAAPTHGHEPRVPLLTEDHSYAPSCSSRPTGSYSARCGIRLHDLYKGSALWRCGLQGSEVGEQRLLQGLGAPTRAGGVPREPERPEPAALAEGVECEELRLRGAVRGGGLLRVLRRLPSAGAPLLRTGSPETRPVASRALPRAPGTRTPLLAFWVGLTANPAGWHASVSARPEGERKDEQVEAVAVEADHLVGPGQEGDQLAAAFGGVEAVLVEVFEVGASEPHRWGVPQALRLARGPDERRRERFGLQVEDDPPQRLGPPPFSASLAARSRSLLSRARWSSSSRTARKRSPSGASGAPAPPMTDRTAA